MRAATSRGHVYGVPGGEFCIFFSRSSYTIIFIIIKQTYKIKFVPLLGAPNMTCSIVSFSDVL